MDSTSQSRYFNEAKSQANIPFLHHQVLKCDSSGQKLHIEDHDITLTIPEGAVAKGKNLYLEVGVTMYGPFIFPTYVQPISPILWLCPLDGDFAVNKPIQIKLPHFLTGLSTDKLQEYRIAFMKANHLDIIDQYDQIYYNFQDINSSEEFCSDEYKSYGVLAIEHCCFYCIKANKSPEMIRDATYCLIRIEKSTPLRYEIRFPTTYLLNTCIKVKFVYCSLIIIVYCNIYFPLQAVKEQYTVKEEYKVIDYKEFKFEGDETESQTTLSLKITVPEDERYTIGMDPVPPEVSIMINFANNNYNYT